MQKFLLIIFYIFLLLLFFLYQIVILQKKEGYSMYRHILNIIMCLYIFIYIYLFIYIYYYSYIKNCFPDLYEDSIININYTFLRNTFLIVEGIYITGISLQYIFAFL